MPRQEAHRTRRMTCGGAAMLSRVYGASLIATCPVLNMLLGLAQNVEGCDAAKFERCLGAAEEHSRPRVGTTGTAGPWNLIPVISLNGDVQVLARSVVVFVRTICSRVADLGPIGGLERGTTVHGQVSVRGVRSPQLFAPEAQPGALRGTVRA
jgi:hypothetical protein